jgi:hypothetical protein
MSTNTESSAAAARRRPDVNFDTRPVTRRSKSFCCLTTLTFSHFFIFLYIGVATAADDTAAEVSEPESFEPDAPNDDSGSDGEFYPSSDDFYSDSESVNVEDIVLDGKCNSTTV